MTENKQDNLKNNSLAESLLYLRGPQARELRAAGHHLKPKVMVGREGVTQALLDSLLPVLTAHQLVKIRVQEGYPEETATAARSLAKASKSRIVQVMGRTFLLYRENPALCLKGEVERDSTPKTPGRRGAIGRFKPVAGRKGGSKSLSTRPVRTRGQGKRGGKG